MTPYSRVAWSCLPGVLVLLVISVFFLEAEPCRIVGDDLIAPKDRPPVGLTLDAAVRAQARWVCRLPDIDRLYPMILVVRVRARLDSVRRNSRGWQVARVDFVFVDKNGRDLDDHRQPVMEGEGSSGWRLHTSYFAIPAAARGARASLENAGSSGVASFEGLAVYPAVLRRSFAIGRAGMLCLWLAAFLAYQVRLKLWRRRLGGLLVLLIVTILVGAVMPEGLFDTWWSNATRVLAAPVDSPSDAGGVASTLRLPEAIKDWGHFGLFGLLALVALESFGGGVGATEKARLAAPPRLAVVSVLLYLMLFAAATEVLQFFVPSRHASVLDWAIDTAGVVLALTVGSLAGRRASR